MSFAQFVRRVENPDTFRALSPHLHVGEPVDEAALPIDEAALAEAVRSFHADGYLVLERVLPPDLCDALALGSTQLRAAGLPSLFLFVYDEAWRAVLGLGRVLDAVLGPDHGVVPDVWAWHLERGANEHGWAVHRGLYHDVRDASGRPRFVNLWIPVTDVDPTNACMYVVPAPLDAGYPSSKEPSDTDLSNARVLPAPRGSVLLWNANVLHWGGRMTPEASSARISLSISAHAPKAPGDLDPRVTFHERIDLLADMILVYGHHAPDLGDAVGWAQANLTMRRLAARKK
jgi:hypothetical protein